MKGAVCVQFSGEAQVVQVIGKIALEVASSSPLDTFVPPLTNTHYSMILPDCLETV